MSDYQRTLNALAEKPLTPTGLARRLAVPRYQALCLLADTENNGHTVNALSELRPGDWAPARRYTLTDAGQEARRAG